MALPFHKLLQTLNSGSSLGSAAVAILASYGTDAHIYLPGIGTLNGYTLGNWLDSGGTTPATVDNPVGLVQDAIGTIHVSQGTTANKPILRKPSNNYYWEFDGVNDRIEAASAPFQMADDHCLIIGMSANAVVHNQYPCYIGRIASPNQLCALIALLNPGTIDAYWRGDDAVSVVASSGSTYTANTPFVTSAVKIGNNKRCRVNGVSGPVNTTAMGATSTLNLTSFGGYSSYNFPGRIYPVITIKGTISDDNLLILERWVGSLTGPTGVTI